MTVEWNVFHAASTARALYRAKYRGLDFKTVIDVGASDSAWSQMCMQHYPNAQYLLIEAQECHKNALDAFCAAHSNARYVMAAAGPERGTCFFDSSDAYSGVASAVPHGKAQVEMPMVSVAGAVAEAELPGPYLLKLDTHGFEPSILRGASEILKRTELVVIEAYIFTLDASEVVTFDELCTLMGTLGFRMVDFSEPMWREKDMALWQWDLFFQRKSHPMFADNSYA